MRTDKFFIKEINNRFYLYHHYSEGFVKKMSYNYFNRNVLRVKFPNADFKLLNDIFNENVENKIDDDSIKIIFDTEQQAIECIDRIYAHLIFKKLTGGVIK